MDRGLIMAMGAEHTNPERLHKIVKTIELQKDRFHQCKATPSVYAELHGLYEPNMPEWCIYDRVQYIAEEKFDGFSYINSGGRFYSKRLSDAKDTKGQPIDKTGHIPHLALILKNVYEICGCDLHGELYIPGGISDDVSSIMGCNEDEAVRRQWSDANYKKLQYILIDIRSYNGKSLINEPYYIRRALLEYVYIKYIIPIDIHSFIQIAPVLPPDPVKLFKDIVSNGGEGLILKRTDAPYVPGKKPANNWVKAKRKITLDAVITGYNDGTGKNKSLFGSIEFGLYIGDELVKKGSTSSGLDDATRQAIAKDPDGHIGRVIEVEAIQQSRNSFRNAVFLRLRADGDKDPKECTPLNIRVKEDLI